MLSLVEFITSKAGFKAVAPMVYAILFFCLI